MEDTTTRAVDHPVDILTAEHRVIQTVLDAMEAQVLALRRGEELRKDWWSRAVEFVEMFADKCHHGKEEALLFPALVAHGVADRGGPVGVMKHEHAHGRELKDAMLRASNKSDVTSLAKHATTFIEFLRQHIDKEDHCLFQMARAHLPQDQVRELLLQFEQFEVDHVGHGTHCFYLGLARDLCLEAGFLFDADAQPTHGSSGSPPRA